MLQWDYQTYNPFGSRGWFTPMDLWHKNQKPWNLSKEQRYNLSSSPGIGWILRAQDNQKWINDYMKNRNLTWDDMQYPAVAPGSGSSFQPINGFLQLSATARFLYR